MYSAPKYLSMLRLAKRSEQTIIAYKKILTSYAKYLGVPLEEVHLHLTPDNLVGYADSRAGKSERGTRLHLSVLHRYFDINGVTFDSLEKNVLTAKRYESQDDKPLTRETLQRMMDSGTVHIRAILTTLISTGMRAGECCQLLISDLDKDTIHIRPEIAKRRRGGDVYLTTEAQEYMQLWLQHRPQYLQDAAKKNLYLVRSGHSKARDDDDQRLFACSYPTLLGLFTRLYNSVDGERGKYRAKCTPHSTRKYFRTHAVKTMPIDLVEKIMRHQGYQTDSYIRISGEDAHRQFKAGESALYIHRSPELDTIKRERDEIRESLEQRLALLELHIKERK